MLGVKVSGPAIAAPLWRDLPERIRAFVAVRFDSEVERKIGAFIADEQRSGDGLSWVRPANLHLTLRFLGDAAETRLVADLATELSAAVSGYGTFTVRLRGLGVFPDLQRPRVFWVGLDSPRLVPLAASVETAARRCGFAPERRPFEPHLTLARIRRGRVSGRVRHIVERHTGSDFGVSEIDRLILYRSHLQPGGSRYDELASFALAAPDSVAR
jgi:2'-5' RNA ligase